MKTPFTNNIPGRHWFENFTRRHHEEISIRTPQNLSQDRTSLSKTKLLDWFKETREHLEQKNLLNIEPSRIFNCDETCIQLYPKPKKVLAPKGAANVYKVVGNNEKENMSVMFMYSAAGDRAPPQVLFKGETIPRNAYFYLPRGWGVGLSDKAWQTTECFYEYITNVFISG